MGHTIDFLSGRFEFLRRAGSSYPLLYCHEKPFRRLQIRRHKFGARGFSNATSLTSPGYKTYVETNTAGFLHTANTQLAGGTNSDQMFVSRQQMIACLTDKLGWNPDALRYFTSFSRDIDQPSLSPHHLSLETNPLPPLRSRSNGGNDQLDDTPGATSAYDKVNPKFLQIRTTSSFTRNDGTQATIGGPLDGSLQTVPEPSVFALFGLGAAGLLLRRRFRASRL